MAPGFALFDTAIGRCGLAWGERCVSAVQLPEADDAGTRSRLIKHLPSLTQSQPPPAVQRAIDGIQALLRGEGGDLLDVELDMQGVPLFHQRVYDVARRIPPGQTRTYGEVAVLLGEPTAARAVGQALGHNRFAPVVPCHRVLAANSRSGGFSANGGVATKLRMLLIEGAAIGEPGLFDGQA